MSDFKSLSNGSYQQWRTPRVIAEQLKVEYDLVLDAAADSENCVTDVFFDGTPGSDGLEQPWEVPYGGVWINPPYNNTAEWLGKAFFEVFSGRCHRAVLLVPASPGVDWMNQALKRAEVHFFDKRIRFELPPGVVNPSRPGTGNALVIIEPDGLLGLTGIRSAKTGRLVYDFTNGVSYPP